MYKDHPDVYHFFTEGVEQVIEWCNFSWLQVDITSPEYQCLQGRTEGGFPGVSGNPFTHQLKH